MLLMLKNILRELARAPGPAFSRRPRERSHICLLCFLTYLSVAYSAYYMTWAACGFRWHASGHRLATGMHP